MVERRDAAASSQAEKQFSGSVLEQATQALRDLHWGLKLVQRAASSLTCAWLVLLIGQALLAPALIVASRSAVNHLAEGMGRMAVDELLANAAAPLAAVGAVLLATQLFTAITGWVRVALSERLRNHVQSLIHEQATQLDLAFFESPASHDLLHRARVDAINVPAQLLEHLGHVLQGSLALLAIAMVLAGYVFWLPLLLIASAVPGLWVVGRYALAANRWRLANTANERLARYQDWLLTHRESAAEIRLFDIGGYIRDNHRRVRSELTQGRLRLEGKQLKAQLWASVAGWLGLTLGMLWILQRAAMGVARIGDVVMCYQGFQQGQKLLRTVLDGAAGSYRSLLFLENLRAFLALRPVMREPALAYPLPAASRYGIRFEHVSFAYPGSEHYALRDLTLEMQAGAITALVGDNGAGKSTLIKLLCRFYDPLEGRILLDGIDLREFPVAELRKQIAVLFQEPLHHHASAAENIALGNLACLHDRWRIEQAAVAAGADIPIQCLPQTYATVLGKWFGGSELSTGEWQRVALARAFLRASPIILLDEPTSAMDAWAETDWLRRFRQFAAGRTALLVTHRFTTAMLAEQICVMQEGRIAQAGTHAELVRLGGRYATAWNEQMSARQPEPRRATIH